VYWLWLIADMKELLWMAWLLGSVIGATGVLLLLHLGVIGC
jgi:hypothetical protein